jgi:hypothetical protein
MLRLTLITAAFAAALGTFAYGQSTPATAEPTRDRGLAVDLGPELPRPEEEARADPRFAAAYRYTTARQVIDVGAPAVIVVCLLALYYSGLGARVARLGGERPVAAALLTAAAVGVVIAAVLGAASALRVAFWRGAGGEAQLGAATARALCGGFGAAAFLFGVGAARARWPRTWWIVVTMASVAAALAWRFLAPLPRAEGPATPTGGVLQERARYLSAQHEMPSYKIAVARGAFPPGAIAAAASPARRKLTASPGAESLGRYEAEVFVASAVLRGEAMQKSLLGPAALLVFMASLLAADALSRAAARRRSGRSRRSRRAPPADMVLFAAFLAAALAVAAPLFNSWSRDVRLGADAAAVRLTRKPITAVALYYKEAAADLVAAEPNPVLHFLADAAPSAAERAAQARRLREELAKP